MTRSPLSSLDDGAPFPLGASFDGRGVNFALFSAHATAVELCLFDPSGQHETRRLKLPGRTDQVWHGYLRGILPGQLYGYRVDGPYEPDEGHRFNRQKLLVDPYARQFAGRVHWHDALFDYRPSRSGAVRPDGRDSAPYVPKSVVEDPAHHWGEDRPPRRPWRDTVIYEAHVKGLTQLHPRLPPAIRGTYDALGHPEVVEHLAKIGVTAVELLPIHAFVDDRFLVDKGLKNYWGYSTLGYFAPEPRYLSADGVLGLKAAISALHEAGIEVILDVVYNHTAEGNHLGPTLSFRGIDNRTYYKHPPAQPEAYWDVTGTGNTLDVSHPRVLRMVLDSMRHWVEAYHVDGFRLDLATALAREPFDFTERAGFLQAVAQDPILSRVKIIAEPWDVGDAGYRLGSFPPGWSEWNDRFRDSVRSFWRGDGGRLPSFVQGLAGSREIFGPGGRQPTASVNYVASHDGYTLADLVSYEQKHNLANGENNHDGHQHNLSWNCGVEGPTGNPRILSLRARQKRNLIATTLLSIGVPMILMGDELSRSQSGNNNAYCQDNPLSWLDWEAGLAADPDLPAFVGAVAAIRRRFDAFRRDSFLDGAHGRHALKDVYWLAPEGRELDHEDWADGERRAVGAQLGNDCKDGQRFLLLMNAGRNRVEFSLPNSLPGGPWVEMLNTAVAEGTVEHGRTIRAGEAIDLQPHALLLFRERAEGPGRRR
ncbi:MAG: glycogen debranching protein GlgX [Bauldia sp.]|nr:glycogen debranching protein GlgX [Bauldia sp.]